MAWRQIGDKPLPDRMMIYIASLNELVYIAAPVT